MDEPTSSCGWYSLAAASCAAISSPINPPDSCCGCWCPWSMVGGVAWLYGELRVCDDAGLKCPCDEATGETEAEALAL